VQVLLLAPSRQGCVQALLLTRRAVCKCRMSAP